MNSKERVTLDAVNTDIGWIKKTLIRLEKKMDDRAEKLEGKMDKHEGEIKTNTAWRWKIIGISIGGATAISIIVSAITLILKFIK